MQLGSEVGGGGGSEAVGPVRGHTTLFKQLYKLKIDLAACTNGLHTTARMQFSTKTTLSKTQPKIN